MKKILTLILVVVAMVLSVPAVAQNFYEIRSGEHNQSANVPDIRRAAANTIELSYSQPDADMWTDLGLSFNGEWRVGIAVVFPKEMVAQYVGCKITHISFGWNTDRFKPVADFFVRNELNGENVASARKQLTHSANNLWKGTKNIIKLDEPYIIEADKDLVIGYFADMQPVGASESCVATTNNGGAKPGINYVLNCSLPESEGGNQWIDIYDTDTPYPIFATATILDEEGKLQNLCSLEDFYVAPIMKLSVDNSDISTGGFVKVANRGTNNINKFVLRYDFGDEKRTYTLNLSQALAPGQIKTYTAPFFAIGSGEHTIKVATVNGRTNALAVAHPFTAIGVPSEVASQYTMTPLVEYFCSENDYNSARNFEDNLLPSLAVHGKDVVVVNQHMNDQFMWYDFDANNQYDDATTMLIDYVDGELKRVEMPVYTANRTAYNNPRGGLPDNPAVYVYTERFADAMLYEPALQTPTFASVNAGYRLNKPEGAEDYNSITVHVDGDIAEGILPEGEVLYLTVYVVEDDIETTSQEFPDDEDFIALWPNGVYYQQNVIRATLTPMYGRRMTNRGAYSYNVDVELEEDWKLEDLSIVAFLSRDIKNGAFQHNVINATETRIDIDTPEVGVTEVNATARGIEIFNLNGQRVGAATRGLYIINGQKTVF